MREPEKYIISKIVKPVMINRKGKNIKSYEVKWRGYLKKSDNTIEPREQLMKDVPKLIKKYDSEHNVIWKTKSLRYTE